METSGPTLNPRTIAIVVATLFLLTSGLTTGTTFPDPTERTNSSALDDGSINDNTAGNDVDETEFVRGNVVSKDVRETLDDGRSADTTPELITASDSERRVSGNIDVAQGLFGAAATINESHNSINTRFSDSIEARIPRGAVDAIGDSPGMESITRPRPVVPDHHGSLVSEGLSNMNVTSRLHDSGINGSNVTVAVVDIGFNVSNEEITNHVAGAKDFEGDGIDNESGLHGTAVAELVVDTAPKASLLLYEIETEAQMGEAIRHITHNTSADVASMSLALLTGPFDGTSEIDRTIDDSVENGTSWFVSAGNYADGQHYNQTWLDGNDDGWMNVSDSKSYVEVDASGEFTVFVSWDDENADYEDYDVYLNDSGSVIDSSTNSQNGSFGPSEIVKGNHSGEYELRIKNANANGTADFDLFVTDRATIDPSTSARSIARPATGEATVAVGAVNVVNNALRRFSSRGPTIDGRTKPNLVAPDGVTTSTYGTFSGTSAAAPHAAGVAALVLDSVNQTISPETVADILTAGPTRLGDGIPNNRTGFGLVNATDAVAIAREMAGVETELDIRKGSISPNTVTESSTTNHDVTLSVRNVTAGTDTVFFFLEFPNEVGLDPNGASTQEGQGELISTNSSVTVVDGPDGDGVGDTLRFGVQPPESDPLVSITGTVNVDISYPAVGSNRTVTVNGSVNDTNDGAVSSPDPIATIDIIDGSNDSIVNVAGKFVDTEGSPVSRSDVIANGPTSEVQRTDTTGAFNIGIVSGADYTLGFAQRHGSSFAPRDGLVDIHEFGIVNSTEDVNKGTLNIPDGHVLNVSVANESGTPVENVSVLIRSGNTFSGSRPVGIGSETNLNGLLQFDGQPPGIEVSGDVQVEISLNEPLQDRFVNRTYTRDITVSEDERITVTLEEETRCIDHAVAGSDGEITLTEIQTATNWWAEDTAVPDTGGETISLSKIQSLINAWAEDRTVSC